MQNQLESAVQLKLPPSQFDPYEYVGDDTPLPPPPTNEGWLPIETNWGEVVGWKRIKRPLLYCV